MSRKPVGVVAMTAAERQRRRRLRVKQHRATLSAEALFRRELVALVEVRRKLYPDLSVAEMRRALDQLIVALLLQEHYDRTGHGDSDHLVLYCAASPYDSMYCLEADLHACHGKLS